MKINARSFKHIKSYVIFCVIFSLLFPYTLMASDAPKYRVPKNSLSYFLQNSSQEKYLETTTESESGNAIPPLTSIGRVRKAPTKATGTLPTGKKVEPLQEAPVVTEVYRSEPETQVKNENEFKMAWKNETPDKMHVSIPNRQIVKKIPAPAIKENKIIPARKFKRKALLAKVVKAIEANKKIIEVEPTTPVNRHEKIKSVTPPDTLFAKALSKMESRRATREAEAQRLGITLPSQNGDIGSVSPSLSKLNTTLNRILSRTSSRA